MCVVSPDNMFCAALVLKPSQSTHRLGRLGFGGEREGEWGANDELRIPDTRTRQSAAHAVLKSASNTWDNVRGPPVWVSVMTERGRGRDGHDLLRDCSDTNALAVWNWGRLK